VCMCVCARVKNTVCMEYGTICGFSYLPGVLECIPQGLGELLYFLSLLFPHLSVSQQCHYWELTRHDLLPGITDQLLIPLSAAQLIFLKDHCNLPHLHYSWGHAHAHMAWDKLVSLFPTSAYFPLALYSWGTCLCPTSTVVEREERPQGNP
jgi:hypothetical protein